MKLKWDINFIMDDNSDIGAFGDVVTKDGEFIGTWSMSEDGNRPYRFTPDGASAPILSRTFVGQLVGDIKEWHDNL